MEYIKLNAYGKINLNLNVYEKNEGYHQLSSLMQGIALSDVISIRLNRRRQRVISFSEFNFESPICRAVADYIIDNRGGDYNGYLIQIEKRIPFSSGLGGSSADIAGIINGFSVLLGISYEEQYDIAVKYGSDTAFLLKPYTALCTGRGEYVDYLVDLPCYYVVICYGVQSETEAVYEEFDKFGKCATGDSVKTYFELAKGEKCLSAKNMLYPAAVKLQDEIAECLAMAMDEKALLTQMTGSGGAVFSLYVSERDAIDKLKEVQKTGKKAILTRFLQKNEQKYLEIE